MKKFKTKLKNLTLFDRALILMAIVLGMVLLYVFFRKSSYVNVTVKVDEEKVLYESWKAEDGTKSWFSQLFYKGMKEKDGLGKIAAEVLDVRSYDTFPSRKAVYITLRLRVVYNRASNQYTFKGKSLLIGSTIKLNLDRVFVDGLITQVEGVRDPRERATLIVEAQIREESPTFLETSGTKEYVANALKVGEEIKDDQGNTVIKILKKRVENAKKTVVTSDGRVIVRTNPLRKDVYLTLQIEALKIHDRYFLFDDIPILIGSKIPINSPTIWVRAEVTGIKNFE